MNVNDVICVGAEPLAMLDYIAIDRADPAVCAEVGVGLARGAELAGVEIPGGELAQLGEMVRGVDVSGACFGTVALDEIIDGSAVQPGDASSASPPPACTPTATPSPARPWTGSRSSEDPEGRLGRPLGDELLEPTEIYVKPMLELLRSEVEVRGLAHITSGGLGNLLRLAAEVGYEIERPAAGAADLRADPGALRHLRRGDARRLQHGLWLLLHRRCRRRGAALELLRRPLPGGEAHWLSGRRPARGPPHLSGRPRFDREPLSRPCPTI